MPIRCIQEHIYPLFPWNSPTLVRPGNNYPRLEAPFAWWPITDAGHLAT